MAIAESQPRTIKVYKPVAEPKAEEKLPAPRPASMAGKVIGFLNHSKDRVDIFLDEIAAALRDQHIDILLVVAGGSGRHMNAVLTSSYAKSVTQAITRQDGTPIQSCMDFPP